VLDPQIGDPAVPPAGRVYLLTGVTGFLGKVVLEELLRRSKELKLERVYVLIRPRASRDVDERFEREVASSDCFSGLPPDWGDAVTVVRGLLEVPGLDLEPEDASRLAAEVTHVVHAAASVEFNLEIKAAARSNITTSLNLLELSRSFRRLRKFVYVSTAYTTPHPGDRVTIEETLAPLPAAPEELLRTIIEGRADERDLLARTGHPNTYTLTKSLAEHLLVARHGQVPLCIVRPSIISASWQHPFPGWIDSVAGFGAFAVMLGMGYMRAAIADPEAKIDVIPVDEVAASILLACESDMRSDGTIQIHHATAGIRRSPTVLDCWETIRDFFSTHRVDRRPAMRYLGPPGLRFALADMIHHRIPVNAAKLRSRRARRAGAQVLSRVTHLNTIFPYFTRKTFDFRTQHDLGDAFDPRQYITTVCRGVYRYILNRDDTQWLLAGRKHSGFPGGDMRWATGQPQGNSIVRFAAWIMAKVLRRCFDRVTVDVHSFEAARKQTPEGSPMVVLPTHRSYFDFVLWSYLFFARPDLGVRIPHIAAATEFGRIPILGRVLDWLHAFYIARGPRKENKDLARRVSALVRDGKTLEFFIEGTRSRSRAFLTPKRGLMRCLQETGRSFTLLPVAISYDRVPEENDFARELSGRPKPEMRLSALLRWTWRTFKGQVDLGRAHLACGVPVVLGPDTNLRIASREVIARLQDATVTTTFHLRAFLQHHPIEGIDADWLQQAIEQRGGRVLESTLEVPANLDPIIAATMRYQFAHLFRNESAFDEPSRRLLEALFGPRGADASHAVAAEEALS
jgi:1-acyl-sn-glycerol-3-phosphate acyltransferase